MRLVWLHRAERVIAAVARPVVPGDRIARWLFFAALVVYFSIGRKIDAAGLFQQNNNFFNADCERVLDNAFHPNRYWSYTSFGSGHPLLGILVSSVIAGLELVFQGAGDLPVRVLCHAAGAAAVGFGYLALRGFDVPRWLLAVGTFGVNAALAPHALLMPPVLWLGRMRFSRWFRKLVFFLVAAMFVAVALAKLQDLVYPGAGFFFQRNTAAEYGSWWSVPSTRPALIHRLSRLVPHFFAYDVVAPTPLYSADANEMTTFMLEDRGLLARYDAFGAPSHSRLRSRSAMPCSSHECSPGTEQAGRSPAREDMWGLEEQITIRS